MKRISYSTLHTHTHYSLLDGYATPKELLTRASEMGLKALAVTEHGNQYSWCYFEKLKNEFPDVKIIYGVEFYECFNMNIQDKNNKYFHLIALSKNENGRKAINKLVTKSNFEGFYSKPRVDLNELKKYGRDLVVSSACLASKLAREVDYKKCVEYVNEYKCIFPHFYLEMQSHRHEDQKAYNKKILQLSNDTETPFIITTDAHAATKEDLYYQARHVQIAHDSETLSEIYEGCYLQTVEEIHEIMDSHIGVDNVTKGLGETNNIARLIDDVKMPFQEPQLPTFPLPDGFDNNEKYLSHLTELGWKHRGIDKFDDETRKIYSERLQHELNIIHKMYYDGYFLIVWDFINFARNNDIMVAPGRGSCAGSLVCYLLQITDLNPIKYGLIFERFLNPERISMPDTDTDVSDRAKVIDYLIGKYGEKCVCQIINFSYITPIVAIKDVGKVLGFKYSEMEKLSKKFVHSTFIECIESNEKFIADNPQYDELIDIAGHLSGRVKTVSCHAGGVGIVDTEIDDYIGMKLGSDGEHIIQVDKRTIEEIGIIKFDILGVQTLNMTKEIINDLSLDEYSININNKEFEDDKFTFKKVLNRALTNGVFQVESGGMKDLLIRLKADSLEDLSAVLALYRPDTMGELDHYINRKNGIEKIEYIHPDMKPILESTYGCLIYQEQLMDIVRKFGGRTYGGADKFRKGIGKKDKKLVQDESNKLYEEIKNNGYTEDIARLISDNMREKGGYLFNKSHSFSYAVICFQTAYLKAYYPLFFFKALFNMNKDKAGMLNKYILDAKAFDITVTPPHINKSDVSFSINNEKILFGLSAITGIGENLSLDIVNERNSGDFDGFNSLKRRVKLNKRNVVSLIKSGAIPTKNKKKLLISYLKSGYELREYKPVVTLPSHLELILKWDIDVEKYRISKRSIDKEKVLLEYNKKKQAIFEEKEERRYSQYSKECSVKYLQNEDFWEFEALQIFINKNPFEQAYSYLSSQFEDVKPGEMCTIVGVIAKVEKKKDKNKKQFAYANIYSSFGLTEAIIWHTQLKEYEDLIVKGNQIAMKCKKDSDEKVIAEKIRPYSQWLYDAKQKEGLLH